MNTRNQTRRQRYAQKAKTAKTFPISVATVNFLHDGNLAFVIRSAVCFGAEAVHVIGSLPDYGELKRLSGSMVDFVKIIQHNNPSSFLDYCRQNDINLVSAEISEEAEELEDYIPDFSRPNCIVVGHEETGVPAEISMNSDNVFIDMPGVGYCLNTSQTANIFLHKFVNLYQSQTLFKSEGRVNANFNQMVC